ncbi:MAG: family 10 glycosylhydrolase [Oscillospiraceae bacterium]|nr:family 10 glycosylhydrolase [Oscillospiraceae bacterium]
MGKVSKKIFALVLVLSIGLGLFSSCNTVNPIDSELEHSAYTNYYDTSSAATASEEDTEVIATLPETTEIDVGAPDATTSAAQTSKIPDTPVQGSVSTAKSGTTTTSAPPAQPSSSSTQKPSAANTPPTTTASTSTTKSSTTTKPATTVKTNTTTTNTAQASLRGIWISYFEVPKATVTKAQYEKTAQAMFAEIAKAGYNTAFVHVRAMADAIYPSEVFPWARWLTGKQGKAPGYDPLAILLAAAKKNGVAFHAWFNPFRVQSSGTDTKDLAKNNPALKWLENSPDKGLVSKIAGGIYFNPAATEVHSLIYSGVKEILKYNVDGIHIDDYFYPTQSKTIDSAQYAAYQKSGGKLSLDAWRRASVNTFVAGLYQTVKSAKKSVVVSISPGGNIRTNYSKLYADAATWGSKTGYVDLLIPQIYYGFENSAQPFEKTVKEWNDLVKISSVKLAFGLAAYKVGTSDSYAGAGKNEWIDKSDILARQAAAIQKIRPQSGLVLFSYSYVFGGNRTSKLEKELKGLYGLRVWS